ncbi:CocE/NonD family hydrolase [Kribbella sp. DT2]|uniref:CocE/NonD family hydrolase n=1 Tax=Kribbella sp. DT2 TaxID=3393427 RepID=UPI003CF09BFB
MKRFRATGLVATALVLALTGVLAGSATAAEPKVAVATATVSVTHEQNDRVPEGATWTQHYFPSSDGSDVELHADVLLPEGLAKSAKVPVILSAGSYFGHSGQTAPEGWKQTGPSNRFQDFIEGTDLFKQGYAFVMVDTRGFGGSTGCLDAAGPGEQADVKAAIDWAARQPWSTGAVGMYGKSYDAITGLIGNNLNQDALKAVVAQEPIWDLYRNIRSNGVPRTTAVTVPSAYNTIASLPQLPDDDARYQANAKYEEKNPECLVANLFDYQIADPQSKYWRDRDYAQHAKGSDTPLFVTQGFLEWNTEPEAMQEYLANHKGPQRAWLGQWDHKRGNEVTVDGRLEMGRKGWFKETLSFYDQYLKGVKPTIAYPKVSIQDSTGTWRAQNEWPVIERSAVIRLRGGSYVDHGGEGKHAKSPGIFNWSQPLTQKTRITATPRIALNAKGNGNLMIKLYDVAPDGKAVMFDEQVSLVKPGRVAFDLKSTDWTLAAGHRIAVEIGTVPPRSGDWVDTPSQEMIKVKDVRLDLDLDNPADDVSTEGARSPYLDTYLSGYTSKLPIGRPTFIVPSARR